MNWTGCVLQVARALTAISLQVMMSPEQETVRRLDLILYWSKPHPYKNCELKQYNKTGKAIKGTLQAATNGIYSKTLQNKNEVYNT